MGDASQEAQVEVALANDRRMRWHLHAIAWAVARGEMVVEIRKPTFVPKYGKLMFRTGLSDPEMIDIPRFEILPCCSAQYKFEITWETRAQKLHCIHQVDKKEEA